jgi:hypothetical protein
MNQTSYEELERAYFAERPILLLAGLILLAAIPIGMLILLMYGSVSGSEFSPDDFTRRHFTYQRIPWLDWTISGIEYTDVTTKLEQTLKTEGLIDSKKPASGAQKTWHLYRDSGVPDSHACDARFLTTYLDFHDWDSKTATSTPFWLKWNEEFPQSAKIFWPTVADLARNEMYLIVPDVMRFAFDVTKDKPKPFESELNKRARAGWILSGESDLQMGNYQRAAKSLFRAQLIEPSEKLTGLIELCRHQVDDFSAIKQRATVAANTLKSNIARAVADDEDPNNDREGAKTASEAVVPSNASQQSLDSSR